MFSYNKHNRDKKKRKVPPTTTALFSCSHHFRHTPTISIMPIDLLLLLYAAAASDCTGKSYCPHHCHRMAAAAIDDAHRLYFIKKKSWLQNVSTLL